MMTEEMLALAAEEVAEAMVASVRVREHSFSPDFLRKMQGLIRRAEHPVAHRALRQAAAVLVAAFTAFALLYMSSTTVQAAVNSWIRDTFGIYIQYAPAETTPPDAQYDYALPEEFDGYTQMTEIELEYGKYFIYANTEGQMLQFQYIPADEGTSLFLDVEHCVQGKATVGNHSADLYLSQDPEKSSIIVWTDEETNTLFYISAIEEREDLIAYAEKVEKFIRK